MDNEDDRITLEVNPAEERRLAAERAERQRRKEIVLAGMRTLALAQTPAPAEPEFPLSTRAARHGRVNWELYWSLDRAGKENLEKAHQRYALLQLKADLGKLEGGVSAARFEGARGILAALLREYLAAGVDEDLVEAAMREEIGYAVGSLSLGLPHGLCTPEAYRRAKDALESEFARPELWRCKARRKRDPEVAELHRRIAEVRAAHAQYKGLDLCRELDRRRVPLPPGCRWSEPTWERNYKVESQRGKLKKWLSQASRRGRLAREGHQDFG